MFVVGASEIESDDTSAVSVRTALELLSAAFTVHSGFAEARIVAGATTFKLKAVTVNCIGGCVLPSGLKDGDLVEVDGTLAADGSLSATRIRLEGAQGGKGEGHHDGEGTPALGSSVMLQDEIHALDATAMTFKLDGATIDYKGVMVSGTLANDAHVKVEGTVDATDAWLIHATAVTVVAGGADDGHHGGGK